MWRASILVLLLAPTAPNIAGELGDPKKLEKSAEKPPPKTKESAADEAEDRRARAAFEHLSAAEKHELVDLFESELAGVNTFQLSLVRWTQKHQDRDPGSWPAVPAQPVFDPKVHAPAQPIERHPLSTADAQVKSAHKTFFAGVPERRLHVGWIYDYATRDVERLENADDPARIFENGLAGFAPKLDLCEALVERALDDGAEQKSLAAFGHAYTDRSGGVYPGITLYDAWLSHAEMEMPDVDTLGVVHTVLDDWKTWTSVVSPAQQETLYPRIGELFQAAHRHRGLRAALARTFFVGDENLGDGYDGQRDNLHALWESAASTPEELAKKLPTSEKWQAFLADWTAQCSRHGEIYQAGIRRRATLEKDARAVRAGLMHALEEYGAFERLTPPAKH